MLKGIDYVKFGSSGPLLPSKALAHSFNWESGLDSGGWLVLLASTASTCAL